MSTRTTKTRPCGHPACATEVSVTKIGCPVHWWALPEPIRHEVTVAYYHRAKDHRRHLVAVGEAIKWWRAQLPKATTAAAS